MNYYSLLVHTLPYVDPEEDGPAELESVNLDRVAVALAGKSSHQSSAVASTSEANHKRFQVLKFRAPPWMYTVYVFSL